MGTARVSRALVGVSPTSQTYRYRPPLVRCICDLVHRPRSHECGGEPSFLIESFDKNSVWMHPADLELP